MIDINLRSNFNLMRMSNDDGEKDVKTESFLRLIPNGSSIRLHELATPTAFVIIGINRNSPH